MVKFFFIAIMGIIWLILLPNSAFASSPHSESEPILVRQGAELFVPSNSPLRKLLVVSAVKELDSPHAVILPGVVEAEPSRIVNILPPLTGRLTELRVNLGDEVKQGQILAIIQSPDLAQAYLDIEKAKDALDLANKSFARARNAYAIGGNAIKDVEQINSNYQQALAEFARAETRLRILNNGENVNAHELRLTASESGTITALNNGLGAYLNDVTATLMTISNIDDVWITANVPENLVGVVGKGQGVEVYLSAYPDQNLKGKITFVSPLLEPDTHRNKARIAFANPENKLKPNMYATVSVEIPQTKQVTVPLSALLMNNDTITVFVETSPWTFVRQRVELGQEDQDYVRITSGLKEGDRVVIQGGILLND